MLGEAVGGIVEVGANVGYSVGGTASGESIQRKGGNEVSVPAGFHAGKESST